MGINYDDIIEGKKSVKEILSRGIEKNPIAQQQKETPMLVSMENYVAIDMRAVRPGFRMFEEEVGRWEQEAARLEVKNDETRAIAVTIGGEATRIKKQIDAARDEIWKPHLEFRKKLDNFVSGFTDRLGKIVATAKAKERRYIDEKEMARREAEKRAQEALAKEQEKLNEEAKAKGIEPIKLEPMMIPKEETKIKTDTGVSSYEHKEWRVEVEKEDQVVRSLCSPDMKKIKEAVKGGLRQGMTGSAGLKIWEHTEQRYRT